MQQILNTWMTMLSRYRRPLRISTLVLLSLGVFLSLPSASISHVSIENFNPTSQSLTIQAPHTLVWTNTMRDMTTQTLLYEPLTFTVQHTLAHTYNLARSLGIGSPLTAISADGQWLAIATAPNTTNGSLPTSGYVEVWSLANQQQMAQIAVTLDNPKQYFWGVVISHDGQQIGWITKGDGLSYNNVTIWDRRTRTILLEKIYDSPQYHNIAYLFLEPPEPLILQNNTDGFELREVRTDKLHYHTVISEQANRIAPWAMSPDDVLMAGRGTDFVTVHRLADGQLLQRFPVRYHDLVSQGNTWNTTMAFSPDHRFLLTASSLTRSRPGLEIGRPDWSLPATEPAKLWDIQTGQIVQRFDVSPDGARMVAYSPDGQYVAAYGKHGDTGEIRVFRVQPQPPFVQPLCLALGLLLLMLVALPWIWLRR